MSFFNRNGKPSVIQSAAPVIRRVTIARPAPQKSRTIVQNASTIPSTSTALKDQSPARRSQTAISSSARQEPTKISTDRKGALTRSSVQHGSETPDFGSDSDGTSEDDDAVKRPTKRRREGTDSPELSRKRQVRDFRSWEESDKVSSKFVHSMELVGGEGASKYSPVFDAPGELPVEVVLQYPGSSQPERFMLVRPTKDAKDHHPITDIIESISQILSHYLPTSISTPLLDPSIGYPFLLTRAYNHTDLMSFQKTLNKHNTLILRSHRDNTIATHLDTILSSRPLPASLIERLMSQCYERTVSPMVHTLGKYESFSDSTYGEILPRFASQIFRDTHLNSTSVFLDLGSGVGSVVLQAALECGCESYGVEFMPNASALAAKQAEEFRSRARLWGLSVGAVEMINGNFFVETKLASQLQRADVILVNNQAFSAQTNDQLVSLFLDVKEGARIVSLKSFVPSGFQLTTRTSEDPRAALVVRHKEYWSGCVSWKDEGGDYYVATVDRKRLERFHLGRQAVGGRRQKRE